MISKIYNIVHDETMTDDKKIEALLAKISTQNTKYLNIRNQLASSEMKLDRIMDANGANSEEHYAKTMMFYGRKFCGSDVINGIKNSSTNSRYQYNNLSDASPYIGDFDGMDSIIPELDAGTFTLTWDCMDGVDDAPGALDIYRDGFAPAVTSIEQPHVLGSNVIMPTIKNMDAATPGFGNGTNTYKLKNGIAVTGWKIKANTTTSGSGKVYLLEPNGIAYKTQSTKSSSGQITSKNIMDLRVFGFDDSRPASSDTPAAAANSGCSNAFKLPFSLSLNPVFPRSITFVLSVVYTWFDIVFVVEEGTGPDTAPWKKKITTVIGQSVTLPLATQVTPNAGWEVDHSLNPYGTWTSVHQSGPDSDVTDMDPYDDPIPVFNGVPGSTYVIGTDLDAGVKKVGQGGAAQEQRIKYLYLKMNSI